ALFFVALSISCGIWLFNGWLSMLPIIASCTGTLALFLLNGVTMRCVMLFGTSLWLVNNIFSGSIGGTMLEATILITNIYTIFRLRRDERVQVPVVEM
ncbi:MAG TPA: YgjV family protein, partial [Rhodocyclaceae bacterium]|nr:YgjV family protein [Rhodocyclaceae bacterium]